MATIVPNYSIPSISQSSQIGTMATVLNFDPKMALDQLLYDSERVILRAMQITGKSRRDIQEVIRPLRLFRK